MDVMSRREIMGKVLAAMASGAQFVKGSFTVEAGVTSYTLNYGKSFSNYILLIEANSASKQQIIDTGSSNDRQRAFFFMLIYPSREINNTLISINTYTAAINPSSQVTATSNNQYTATESSVTINVSSINSAGNYRLFNGLTYNYYVVEIK